MKPGGVDWLSASTGRAAADPVVEMAGRESRCAWKDFLVRLKGRGLKGVELVVSRRPCRFVAAIGEVDPGSCLAALLRTIKKRRCAEALRKHLQASMRGKPG